MARYTLDFSEGTLQAMEELVDITGIKRDKDGLAQLIQDSIRTYEWIISQQLQGKIIVALEKQDIGVLEKSPEVHGDRKYLEPFFPQDKIQKALEYFKKAA